MKVTWAEGDAEGDPVISPVITSGDQTVWTAHIVAHDVDAANQIAADIVKAVNCHEALVEALEQMVDEKCDYRRINNLGDPEQQHTIKLARAALSRSRNGG